MRRLLLFFFGLLYNQLAWTYDLVSWAVSVGQWRAWQRQALPLLKAGPLLEIAHGTGDLQIDLAAAGYRPVAFDFSPAMGRIARAKLARRRLNPPFVRGRAQALPFPSGGFAGIVTTFPAEFISDPASAREFARVLAPGGRLVIVPAATILPAGLLDRLAAWLFSVTGQSAPPAVYEADLWPRLLGPYRAAGLNVRAERVNLPRSVVWVIVAEK